MTNKLGSKKKKPVMNIASNTNAGADAPKSSIEVNDESPNKSNDKGNKTPECIVPLGYPSEGNLKTLNIT